MTALAIDRGMLGGLAAEISRGAVLVTGTNGKGTTCRMLGGMMRASGLHPILNHEGSNRHTGLVTTLFAHASPLGHLPADDQAIGPFEVDEGSLPEILPQVRPDVLVFTNIFRDQMDRYLELDYLTRRWERALRALPADATLVLNADDPRLACLASEVLRALLGDGQPKHMLLGLNDRASNQQPDVSWIWDVDFESLRELVPAAVLSGNRATDLAVRLKSAGWLGPEARHAADGAGATDIAVEPDPLPALQLALDRTPAQQPLWVVSTYLVLWQIRSWLRRQGYVGALWER